ncbi:RGS domain-containing protein, partial [Delphinella strobiligena]
MIVRKESSISVDSAHSTKSPCSSVGDCDADDEGTMSMDEAVSKPLTVATGSEGIYYPKRPNLQEILANDAPSPWTLTAFMAYLSTNHCLETLEFTMDAGRYKKHYQRMMNKAPSPGEPAPQDAEYVSELWNRLIEAYIQPSGSREVNLPSEVRDPIIHLSPSSLPPSPEILDPAVMKTYELMEESVLVPFLNSAQPQPNRNPIPNSYYSNSQENLSAQPQDNRLGRRSRHHSSRSSPPPSGLDHSAHAHPPMPNRKSAPSTLTTALTKHRFSARLSPTSSQPSAPLISSIGAISSASDTFISGPGLTDDSGSSGSPTNESPMTPPVTPPMGD